MIRKAQRNRLHQLFAGSACLLALAALVMAGTACPLAAQTMPEKEKQTFPAAAEAGPSPKPVPDGFKMGSYDAHLAFEVGGRLGSDVRGNNNVYRTMVNLNEGFKLFNADFSMRAPYGSGKVFDHLDFNSNSWGGEPYSTIRFSMGRTDKYELNIDYRRHEYFFNMPVYANPLLQTGNLQSQHATDMGMQTTDVQLKFLPNSKIRPFVAYSHNSGTNSDVTPSFTTYSVTGNEFMLFKKWNFSSDEYRGGVEFAFSKLFLSLQQGWRLVKEDEGENGVGNPRGNNSTPFLGQTITMTGLSRGYHDRLTLPVTQGVVTFTPFQNFKISGRYIYSMSTMESSLNETSQGNLLSLENRVAYAAASDAFSTRAKQPNHLGSFVIEYSPWRRLTLMNRFETRSQHTSGYGLLNSTLYNSRILGSNVPAGTQTLSDIAQTLLTFDRIQNDSDLEFEIGGGLVVHGGYRYWTADTTMQDVSGESPEYTSASRKAVTTGFYFTRGQWLNVGLDYEKNMSNGVLTRTSLNDFDRFRFDWRVGTWHNLSLNGRAAFLRNSNPQTDVDWENHNHDYTVALNYSPKWFYLSLDYSHYSIFSDMFIVLPATFERARSLFDERSEGLGMTAGVNIWKLAKVELGYRGVKSAGSLPLRYDQPFAGITIPVPGHMAFKTYWWYYNYNDRRILIDSFRRNLVTFSLAFNY